MAEDGDTSGIVTGGQIVKWQGATRSKLEVFSPMYVTGRDLQWLRRLCELVLNPTQSKSPATSLPPITSFSWNATSPNSIVTCSIDTTATLWDINTSQALTQLIAHDRAVYDL